MGYLVFDQLVWGFGKTKLKDHFTISKDLNRPVKNKRLLFLE
jgi:hypothetical protein